MLKLILKTKLTHSQKKKKRSILPFNTSYLNNKQSGYVIAICFISLFLLIYTSPILSLLWLIVPTGYFLINCKYKSILKIWGFTFCTWYFIFTTTLGGTTILVGFENTEVITSYVWRNTFMFESLCYDTIFLLDILSAKLGVSLYFPSVIRIVISLKCFIFLFIVPRLRLFMFKT